MDKKFDPEKRKNLNDPERLQWITPETFWELINYNNPELIVDVGAGTGYLTHEYAKLAPKAHIAALDIEPLMIQEMQENLPKDSPVQPVQMNDSEIPHEDKTVDIVWMINLYHELPHPERLLKDIKRALKPGGKLLIVDWDKNPDNNEKGPPLNHRISLEQAKKDLQDHGFQIENNRRFEMHYAVVTNI